MLLKSKVACITGGMRGIGAGIARRFLEEGATVALCDIVSESSEVTVEGREDRAKFYPMDVSSEEQINNVVAAIFSDHAKIDILVNNAGITNDKLLLRMTREDWQRVIDVNLTGTFLVTRAVMKHMIKQRYGRIINIASVVGLTGNAGQANYAASKAGIIGFTKSCAKELASRNITVNAIAPGFIATRMTEVLTDEMKENFLNVIPLRRFGTVDDVAQLVLFLASDQASYITGQVISIDGGMVM